LHHNSFTNFSSCAITSLELFFEANNPEVTSHLKGLHTEKIKGHKFSGELLDNFKRIQNAKAMHVKCSMKLKGKGITQG
jgi:hypothetical protein